jgi:hypothetical protein
MARTYQETGFPYDTDPSNGLRHDDIVAELRGRRGIKRFREMSENDSIVGAVLTAFDQMIRGIEWRVEGGEESLRDFVKDYVMHDLNLSWTEQVSEFLTFLPYGFSLFEMVPERKPNGMIGMKKLAPRPQWTIERFITTPKGDLMTVEQSTNMGYANIPYARLLHFKTTGASSEPSGRSVLRSAYVSWRMVNRMREIEAVGVERDLSGVPMFRLPGEWLAEDAEGWQKAFVKQASVVARDVRRNEQSFVIVPSNLYENEDGSLTNNRMVEFELISTKGTRLFDTDKIIARYEMAIARSVLADFLVLGSNDRGSFSMASSKSELFLKSLEAHAATISSELNDKMLPFLADLNGVDMDDMPRIRAGRIAPVNITELGQYVQRLALAGMDLFPDEDVENHLRNAAGLPEGDPDRPRPNAAAAMQMEEGDPTDLEDETRTLDDVTVTEGG